MARSSWRPRASRISLSVDLVRAVIESCPTRLLLANPSMDRSQYRELFQMNEMELDALEALTAAPGDPVEASWAWPRC